LYPARASYLAEGNTKMARPIEPTPILKGKDAKDFITRMDAAVMTRERLTYLRCAAEESKRAEQRGDSKSK
jgi:hypothetical protein